MKQPPNGLRGRAGDMIRAVENGDPGPIEKWQTRKVFIPLCMDSAVAPWVSRDKHFLLPLWTLLLGPVHNARFFRWASHITFDHALQWNQPLWRSIVIHSRDIRHYYKFFINENIQTSAWSKRGRKCFSKYKPDLQLLLLWYPSVHIIHLRNVPVISYLWLQQILNFLAELLDQGLSVSFI